MKPPAAAASTGKPLKYGTRKSKAGEAKPVIQSIGSVSVTEDEGEIEMDDLPIRANAPKELIDAHKHPSESQGEEDGFRPRRQGRSRERRERRERRETARKPSEAASEETEAPEGEQRPERFGTVRRKDASSVQEFRPSRDGRTAPKRAPRARGERSSVEMPKKRGFLSKLIAFFTGDTEKEEEVLPRKRSGRRRPGTRGGSAQDRSGRSGEREGGGPRRRRRPRNRKPRPEGGEGGEGGQQPKGEGQRRRRRRPRRRRDDERPQAKASRL